MGAVPSQAGLGAARARERLSGRTEGLSKKAESTAAAAEALYREGKLSINEITGMLGISKSGLYLYLGHKGVKVGTYRN